MKRIIVLFLVLVLSFSFLSASAEERPSVALVLAGGGAKGFAQIPIIAELEARGIPIDRVYGTSIGALLGGIYSAGYTPKEIERLVLENDLMDLFTTFESTGYRSLIEPFDYSRYNFLSLSLTDGGVGGVNAIIDDYKVMNFFQKALGNVPDDIDFDDLPISFRCNASNLMDKGNRHLFTSGPLTTAMRASMSLPLIFSPVVLDEHTVLMDGGMESNTLCNQAKEDGFDIIICINLPTKDDEISLESFSSIPSTVIAALNDMIERVSIPEIGVADFVFNPDLTGVGVMSFGMAEEVLHRGVEEVERQKEMLDEISSLFTEEQKVYKNPDRVGEYFIRFQPIGRQDKKAQNASNITSAYAQTRISAGVYGSGEVEIHPSDSKKSSSSYLSPTLSLSAFIKDFNGSRFSFIFDEKMTVNKTSLTSSDVLFRMSQDKGLRTFGVVGLDFEAGSLSYLTDRRQALSYNDLFEYRIGGNVGLKVTNEVSNNFNLLAKVDYLQVGSTLNQDKEPQGSSRYFHYLYPKAEFSFALYSANRDDYYVSNGYRVDFLSSIGLCDERLRYRLAFAGEYDISLSDKTSMWLSLDAHTSREPEALVSSYSSYGGINGMPGYSADTIFLDYVMGLVGVQLQLANSFANSYVALEVGGGVRCNDYYYAGHQAQKNRSLVPFSTFADPHFDLGIKASYGWQSFIGNFIVGAGVNLDRQVSIFVTIQ